MHNEMEEKDTIVFSLPHEEWCNQFFTLEDKDNKKRNADQTKRIDIQKYAVGYSDM